MFNEAKICVIIPAYNAAQSITEVIDTLPEWVDQIIAVNDCSKDDTLEVLRNMSEPRLKVISHEKNQGVGGAMKTGYAEGVSGDADIFVKIDSDGQMDPDQIHRLLNPIIAKEANYTKGNRFLQTKQLKAMPPLRRLGNFVMSFFSKIATGFWNIFDPTNGFTAISRQALELIDLSQLDNGYYFETSLLEALYLVRVPIKDVSMHAIYKGEKSYLSESKVLVQFPIKMIATFFNRIHLTYFMQDFNAVSIFLVVGSISLLFGFFWGVVQWRIASLANTPASTGTVMIAVLPIFLGIQLLLEALVLDTQNTPRDFIEKE
ncbi:MAG: glycosyltransferase family 2 protein [Anaerolineaceae bacterium]